MPVYRDEAVVLRTHKLGEADRIVTLLTRQHGKVRAVAKGVRRTGSKFGARLEPFMVADLQLYEGRSLDVVTQAESLGSYGAEISQDYAAYTAANAMVETADKLTEAEGSLQQYLLLVGALRSLARGEHGAEPHPRLLPAARPRPRGVGAELPGLCALRPNRRAHGRRRATRRGRLRRLRAARHATDRTLDGRPPRGAPRRRLGVRRGVERRRPQPGERHRRRLHAMASRAGPPLAAARLQRVDHHVSPKPYTHRDAVPYVPIDWTGIHPPELPKGAVPEHVAIVMDGNGRWANRRGLTRIEGHKAGEVALLDVVAGAIQAGVKHLSVYAFSTENWKRSPEEVRFLMGYNRDVLHRRRDQLNEWGVRIRWAGRRPRLWASVINELQFAERLTAGNDTLTLTMCVNYGGRTEIADAVRSIADDVASGRLKPSAVSEKLIQKRLYVPELPDVDLFVRSSGEQRTSNFMLWQSAYAEMVFLDTLWPDFSRVDLWQAIDVYARRNRRFGGAVDTPTAAR